MIVPLILSVLLGALLGRFCNVLVLLLACAFVLFIYILKFGFAEHGLAHSLFEYVALSTGLQIGYILGLFSDEPFNSRSCGVRRSRSL